MADTTKKKRVTKTREQRATERLATTDRLITRAIKKLDAAEREVEELHDEIADLRARREYEAMDPALTKGVVEAPADGSLSEPITGDE